MKLVGDNMSGKAVRNDDGTPTDGKKLYNIDSENLKYQIRVLYAVYT